MLDCIWDTLDNWATLVGQDVSIYDGVVGHAGPTYTRVCADGTVYLEKTLALIISGGLP
jgi:hypothetical protein